jgi:hypothetical protein
MVNNKIALMNQYNQIGGMWNREIKNIVSNNITMTTPQPNLVLVPPDPILINEQFDLLVQFNNSNTSHPDAIGFAPAYDIIVPNTVTLYDIPLLATWALSGGIYQWLDSSSDPIIFYPEYPSIPINSQGTNPGDKLYDCILPYSSYGPDQPTISTVYKMIINGPNNTIPISLPSVGIKSYGMFFLGTNALEDTLVDPPIFQPIITQQITPKQYTIKKRHLSLTGSSNATGPNYPIPFEIELHIAPNQTIQDPIIRDTLDPSMRPYTPTPVTFSSSESGFVAPTQNQVTVPGSGTYRIPEPTDDPAQEYAFHFNQITGQSTLIDPVTLNATSGSIIKINYSLYADYYNYKPSICQYQSTDLTYVINPVNPQSSINVNNSASLYDSTTMIETNTDTFPIAPLVITKSSDWPSDNPYIGSIVNHTINLYISDYFAYSNLIVTDDISTGHLYINTHNNQQTYDTSAPYLPRHQFINGISAPIPDNPDISIIGSSVPTLTAPPDTVPITVINPMDPRPFIDTVDAPISTDPKLTISVGNSVPTVPYGDLTHLVYAIPDASNYPAGAYFGSIYKAKVSLSNLPPLSPDPIDPCETGPYLDPLGQTPNPGWNPGQTVLTIRYDTVVQNSYQHPAIPGTLDGNQKVEMLGTLNNDASVTGQHRNSMSGQLQNQNIQEAGTSYV